MSDLTVHPAITSLLGVLGLPPQVPGAQFDKEYAQSFAIWLLEYSAPWPAAVAGLMQELVTLHRQDMSATPPDPAAWQQIRRKVVLLEDGGDELIQRLMVVAEAAAWPIATGRAALTELFKAVSNVVALNAARSTGWTHEDEAQAESLLKEIADGKGGTPPAREAIPGLFAKAAPALEKRFVRQLDASNNGYVAFRQLVISRIKGE